MIHMKGVVACVFSFLHLQNTRGTTRWDSVKGQFGPDDELKLRTSRLQKQDTSSPGDHRILQWEYDDATNGRSLRLTLSPNVNTSSVKGIMYRSYRCRDQTASTPETTSPRFKLDVTSSRPTLQTACSVSLWLPLKLPNPITRDIRFIKPNFCQTFEFQLISDGNLSVVNSGKHSLSEIVNNLPPASFSNASVLRLKELFLHQSDDRIYASIDLNPAVSFWANAQIRSFDPKLTPLTCQTLFSAPVASQPSLKDNGRMIVFDKAYAEHDCSFNYSFAAEMFVNDGGQSCSAEISLPEDKALTIQLSCKNVQGLVCRRNESLTCTDCLPVNVTREPFLRWNKLTNQADKILRVSWTFSEDPGNRGIPRQYRVRTSTAILTKHNYALGETDAHEEILQTRYKDLRPRTDGAGDLETPIYVIQICAVYQTDCERTPVDWTNAPKHPIYFKERDTELIWKEKELSGQYVQQSHPTESCAADYTMSLLNLLSWLSFSKLLDLAFTYGSLIR